MTNDEYIGKLTDLVDRLHVLLHDESGKGMWSWTKAVLELQGEIAGMWAPQKQVEDTQALEEHAHEILECVACKQQDVRMQISVDQLGHKMCGCGSGEFVSLGVSPLRCRFCRRYIKPGTDHLVDGGERCCDDCFDERMRG